MKMEFIPVGQLGWGTGVCVCVRVCVHVHMSSMYCTYYSAANQYKHHITPAAPLMLVSSPGKMKGAPVHTLMMSMRQ